MTNAVSIALVGIDRDERDRGIKAENCLGGCRAGFNVDLWGDAALMGLRRQTPPELAHVSRSSQSAHETEEVVGRLAVVVAAPPTVLVVRFGHARRRLRTNENAVIRIQHDANVSRPVNEIASARRINLLEVGRIGEIVGEYVGHARGHGPAQNSEHELVTNHLAVADLVSYQAFIVSRVCCNVVAHPSYLVRELRKETSFSRPMEYPISASAIFLTVCCGGLWVSGRSFRLRVRPKNPVDKMLGRRSQPCALDPGLSLHDVFACVRPSAR